MQEREIERLVVKAASRIGYSSRKLQWLGRIGAPDRVFGKPGRFLFIEFKQKGKKPTKLQNDEIEFLRSSGCEVYVCDSVESAMTVLNMIPNRYHGDLI